jgi:hypothetical protein
MGSTENEISFQVGSSLQKYNLPDIVLLRFDSEREVSQQLKPSMSSLPSEPQPAEEAGTKTLAYVTIPAGTHMTVRTIDAIDSTQSRMSELTTSLQTLVELSLLLFGHQGYADSPRIHDNRTGSLEMPTS